MGFGEIGASAIMFIAVMTMATGLVFVFKAPTEEIAQSSAVRQQVLANQLDTRIVAEHVYYDAVNEQVYAYYKNVGRTAHRSQDFSFYVENEYFKLDNTNAQVTAGTDTKNIGVFDKNEVILVNVSVTLNADEQFTIRLIDTFGGIALATLTT